MIVSIEAEVSGGLRFKGYQDFSRSGPCAAAAVIRFSGVTLDSRG